MWERWCQVWQPWIVATITSGLEWMVTRLPPRVLVAVVVLVWGIAALAYGVALIVWVLGW